MHITENSTTSEVLNWLRNTIPRQSYLEDIALWIEREEVNGEVLLSLSEQDLKDELPTLLFGERRMFYRRIQQIQVPQPAFAIPITAPSTRTPVFKLDPKLFSEDDSDEVSLGDPFETLGSFMSDKPLAPLTSLDLSKSLLAINREYISVNTLEVDVMSRLASNAMYVTWFNLQDKPPAFTFIKCGANTY